MSRGSCIDAIAGQYAERTEFTSSANVQNSVSAASPVGCSIVMARSLTAPELT